MRRLNTHWLGERFVAIERLTVSEHSEIDIASFDRFPSESPGTNGTAVATLPAWSAAAPSLTYPAAFPEFNEIQIASEESGRIVAAIELVSPGNKDRPATRQAFAAKCVDYLHQGVCVVIIDVVTERKASLHNLIVEATDAPIEARLPDHMTTYAATYRPVSREFDFQIDLWTSPCELGKPLPTMPMRLTGDTFVPVEFEMTYASACSLLRLKP